MARAHVIQRISSHGFQYARRIAVAIIGTTVLLFGVALLFLPGPAIVVIPVGLAILATEFVWARRLLKRAKAMFVQPKNSKGS